MPRCRGPRRRWPRRGPCAGSPTPGGAGRRRAGRGGPHASASRPRSRRGTSASNTSSAMTTRLAGSSSAAQHDSSVVLPEPGAPANTIERSARTQAARKRATCRSSMSRATSSSRERKATPVKRRMLTIRCPPRLTSACTMCSREPSSSWASCRPSAGSSLRWLAEDVVEDLGQRAGDVVVVVEDLVVVARRCPRGASRGSRRGR